MSKTPVHRARKAKTTGATHTQAASEINPLLYFQTLRSTLRTLKFPLPQGKAPLSSSDCNFAPPKATSSLLQRFLSRLGVLCPPHVRGSGKKGPVECTVSLLLNQSITQSTAANPLERSYARKKKTLPGAFHTDRGKFVPIKRHNFIARQEMYHLGTLCCPLPAAHTHVFLSSIRLQIKPCSHWKISLIP